MSGKKWDTEIYRIHHETMRKTADQYAQSYAKEAADSRREALRYVVGGAAGGVAILVSLIDPSRWIDVLAAVAIAFFTLSLAWSIRARNDAVSDYYDNVSAWAKWSSDETTKLMHAFEADASPPDWAPGPEFDLAVAGKRELEAAGLLGIGGAFAFLYLISLFAVAMFDRYCG